MNKNNHNQFNGNSETKAGDSSSPRTEEAPSPKEKKEKKKGRGTLGFAVFFLGSFIAVFATVWITLTKIQPPPLEPDIQTAADSTQQSLLPGELSSFEEEPAKDSLEADALTLFEVDTGDEPDNQDLVKKIYEMRSRLAEKEMQIQQVTNILKENERLANENENLKNDMQQREKDFEYYTETLPSNVARQFLEYQKKLNEKQKTAMQPVQVQSSAAGGMSGGVVGAGQTQEDAVSSGVRKLAKIYEAMRPELAAPILSKLDDDEIIDILLRMNQRNAAKVLTNFDPNLAARITKRMGEI